MDTIIVNKKSSELLTGGVQLPFPTESGKYIFILEVLYTNWEGNRYVSHTINKVKIVNNKGHRFGFIIDPKSVSKPLDNIHCYSEISLTSSVGNLAHVQEVRYFWIPLDVDSICQCIANVFESNKKLTEEN